MALRFEPYHRRFHRRQFLFEERNNLLIPEFHGSLAAIPAREPADPFYEQNAVIIQNFGDRDAAAINGQIAFV